MGEFLYRNFMRRFHFLILVQKGLTKKLSSWMSILWCCLLNKFIDNLFWVISWYVWVIRWLGPKRISCKHYPCLAVETSKGKYCLSKLHRDCENKNCQLVKCKVLFYGYDGIKKASRVSVCGAFKLTKKRLDSLSHDCSQLHSSVRPVISNCFQVILFFDCNE